MTPGEYRAKLRSYGLTPAKPSYDGATLYQDRDGMFTSVPDPEQLSSSERVAMLELIALRGGHSEAH